MTHQTLRLIEGFVTQGTVVLLLHHMSFYMVSHVFSIGKSLFTLRTGEGLLSCVDSTVFVQGTRIREGLVTGGAGEWLISCVCPLVSLQGFRMGEVFVTG